MGGYGTLRIGMKHPEVFGALYAASSCCLMNNAPDYFDLPATAGDRAELVAARWPANSPLVMVGQYVPALQSFDGAIVIDVGDQAPLGVATTPLNEELTRLRIEHRFELYTGNHMNQIPSPFVCEVLPFFAAELR